MANEETARDNNEKQIIILQGHNGPGPHCLPAHAGRGHHLSSLSTEEHQKVVQILHMT